MKHVDAYFHKTKKYVGAPDRFLQQCVNVCVCIINSLCPNLTSINHDFWPQFVSSLHNGQIGCCIGDVVPGDQTKTTVFMKGGSALAFEVRFLRPLVLVRPRAGMATLRFGQCEHYRRTCLLVAPCCNQVVHCRFCHDAHWEACG